MLRAIDIYTGRLLWETKLPGIGFFYNNLLHQPGANASGGNFVCTPEAIYAVHGKYCKILDPATGKSQWCNSYADDPLGGAISDQTTVYIPLGDGVHALQKSNGKLKWIYKGNTSGKAQMVTDGLSFDH